VVTAGLMNTQGDTLSGYPKWQITDRDEVAAEVLQSIGRKHLVAPCWQTRVTVRLMTRLMSRRRAVTSMGTSWQAGWARMAVKPHTVTKRTAPRP
jgi:hypothetical protein